MAQRADVLPAVERAPWLDRIGIAQRQPALLLAAAGSWLAAGIHAALIADHWRYWVPAGVFFAASAALQLLSTAALLGRARARSLVAIVAVNTFVVVVYVVSRTSGIPGAPGITAHGSAPGPGVPILPGAVERVGAQDLLSLVAELTVIALCALSLRGRVRARVLDALALTGAAMIVASALGVLA